ncbi:hypothetical protein ARTHRO9V_90395 [Arthrobacter sp. 9V]|nr:hypothetical protein ARTHRO9V_90395 [Arthrobacter sp. 9V]
MKASCPQGQGAFARLDAIHPIKALDQAVLDFC